MNVDITGARIYFTIPIFGGIPITATIVNSLLVTLIIIGLSIFLTRNLKVRAVSRRQVVAEFLVETAQNFVNGNMGEKFAYYGPFVAALFASSLFSSLLSLVGMFPPTSDLSTTLAWAVMVFVLITYTKIRTGGVGGYLKGFTQPIFVLTPFNILSELATPISMAFRHFGNIVSGSVITALVYAALATASHALFAWLPGAAGELLGSIPILQVGVPAVLKMLPIRYERREAKNTAESLTIYEPSSEAVYDAIVPEYVGGLLWGAMAESVASEQGARRTAMDAASKNAGDMIEDLSLKYNRARQGAITQEITEIVAGAEA